MKRGLIQILVNPFSTALCLALLFTASVTAQAPKKSPDEEMVDRVHDSVLLLAASNDRQAIMGSGFVLDTSGLLVTNFHVLAGMCQVINQSGRKAEIWVGPEHGQNLGEPDVVAETKERDLAILRLPHKAGRGVQLSDSSKLHLAQEVSALGFPDSYGLTVDLTYTKGTISALRTVEGLTFIAHTAAIAHGNSGGPLLNSAGDVVGVNDFMTAVTVETNENGKKKERDLILPGASNYAIPSNDVRKLLSQAHEPIPIRNFCGGSSGTLLPSGGAGSQEDQNLQIVYKSDQVCLGPGERSELTGRLRAGVRYAVVVKRLGGNGRIAFGVGSSRNDFQTTDQEDKDGMLVVIYRPTHTRDYRFIIGNTSRSAEGETCVMLAVVTEQA